MDAHDITPIGGVFERRDAVLEAYKLSSRRTEIGHVVSVGDGIVWFSGLPSASIDEVVEVEDGSQAMVFHLGRDIIGAVLLEETKRLAAGLVARKTGRLLAIPVGPHLIGRVIDPLGAALDGAQLPEFSQLQTIDTPSAPIIQREFVTRPMYTGNKIIDSIIPIGKGQRQLLIGDNGLGKTALALDIVANQKHKQVYCIYVLIGQKRSTVLHVLNTLKEVGAMDYTTIVVAEATALPGLRYLAPYSGCTLAEAAMRDGKDTLIIYDDLTNHAQSYREMSLLLRRPPGREAYPADIFYLHSRLLERATCLASSFGGGSMTALPIIETEGGDITAYIPTNLISITDGQIVFNSGLFAEGFLPAVDVSRSVSRIGGKAQDPSIRLEAGRAKLDYLQFLELESFARFGARLEPSMERRLRRGRILREILKQERLSPVAIELELAWMIAYNDGYFDNLELGAAHQRLQHFFKEMVRVGISLDEPRPSICKKIAGLFEADVGS